MEWSKFGVVYDSCVLMPNGSVCCLHSCDRLGKGKRKAVYLLLDSEVVGPVE